VRGGEASLAALGAAGAQPVAQPGSPAESSTAPVIAVIVQALPTPGVSARLADPHALVREAAAHEAGRRHAWDAVPRLIEALGDPSEDVRLASRQALKRISGEVSDPWFAGAPLADVQQRWRVWWNQVGRARANEGGRRG
jgi:HEAT repeat protein